MLCDPNKGASPVAELLKVKSAGSGDKAVVLLHGLFGSGNNLGQIARGLIDSFRVFSVDLPDHGRSAWLASASIEAYAERIAEWMDSEALSQAFMIGHSLGGKVAMQLAVLRPELIQRLVVLDIIPVAYTERRHDDIFEGLHAVSIAGVSSRQQARNILMGSIQESDTADFLLTSVFRNEEGLIEWRFNVSGLEAAYANFLGGLYLPDDAVIPSEVPVLILRGADSNYVPNTANRELASLFSALSVITVKNAGHWLHQEQTETVLTMVRRHFAP